MSDDNNDIFQADGFRDHIPDDLRDDPSLQDINDIASLAKSYVNAQRMIGSSVRIPTEDASEDALDEFYNKVTAVPGVMRAPNEDDPEAMNQFYQKLGRPESPDQYELEVPVESDPIKNEFVQVAHEIGLTKQQANKLAGWQLGLAQQQEEQFHVQREAAQSDLKKQWGADFDTRLAGAKAAVQHFTNEYGDSMKELVDGPSGNNPAFIAVMSQLGEQLQESNTITTPGANAYGMTPGDAQNQLNDILDNPDHAYWDDNAPGHSEAVKKVRRLNNVIYPD